MNSDGIFKSQKQRYNIGNIAYIDVNVDIARLPN